MEVGGARVEQVAVMVALMVAATAEMAVGVAAAAGAAQLRRC